MRVSTNPNAAALTGALLLVPFVVLNTIVANRIEPFVSLIRPGIHTSALEYVLLFTVLLLMPVGALIALRPMLERRTDGRRRRYLGNGLVAAVMLIAFLLLSVGLGVEIYRCDVLQIPNCD
jgi:hypothetical protein